MKIWLPFVGKVDVKKVIMSYLMFSSSIIAGGLKSSSAEKVTTALDTTTFDKCQGGNMTACVEYISGSNRVINSLMEIEKSGIAKEPEFLSLLQNGAKIKHDREQALQELYKQDLEFATLLSEQRHSRENSYFSSTLPDADTQQDANDVSERTRRP